MYKIDANRIVGQKIHETRNLLGISQETLSDRINDACNIHVTMDMLGRYERGERKIDQDTLVAIAIGLETSLQNLQDLIDPRNENQDAAPRQIKRLSPEEHNIFRHMATTWRGDRRALIIADGCYMALPEAYAARAILGVMTEVTRALADGAISPADLPAGLPYLERKIGDLIAATEGSE